MAKKSYRSDNTYLISGDKGDNPKLMGRAMTDGRDSLYLEYFLGKTESVSKSGKLYMKNERRTELLNLFIYSNPRTPIERKQNNEILATAKKIRFERGEAFRNDREGYRLKLEQQDMNFLDWMWNYYQNYTKADKRHIKRAHDVLIDYLIDPENKITPPHHCTREQREEAKRIKAELSRGLVLRPSQVTKEFISGFVDYVQKRFHGDGPHSLYSRFKKVIKAAVDADVLRKNPCEGVVIKIDRVIIKKDILSLEEVQKLAAVHCPGENPEVRRAFLFCLYTGMRWCDVKDLTYGNVDFANRLLKFEQNKTRGHSSNSGVIIPLNDNHMRLIGRGHRSDLIFKLPTHNMCLKALRHWVKRAGIEKHITWHCARHSFAVNILNNGANIKTVSSLLGHSSLEQTEKYTRAIDSLKVAAINTLPELDL